MVTVPHFPMNTESPTDFFTLEKRAHNCYSLRTFDRFLNYFGLIKIERDENKWTFDTHITKTDLFDKLIKVKPHKTQ